MMGERVAQNMYSRIEINKSKIVASCWSPFVIILAMNEHMQVKFKTSETNFISTVVFGRVDNVTFAGKNNCDRN
jgi:hypothetical protein